MCRGTLLIIVLVWATASHAVDKINLDPCAFAKIFHHINSEISTTTLRKELKVTVTDSDVAKFLQQIEQIVGDHLVTEEKDKRVKFREAPSDPNNYYFTQTDYLPVVKAVSAKNGEIYKAYIRLRRYFEVPKGTKTNNFLDAPTTKVQKLADQPGEYVKLEFKVGHPESSHELGESKDMVGVVDKPGITLERKDADALFESKDSYLNSKAAIAQRAKGLTLTGSSGKTKTVNKETDVDTLIERIGLLHDAGLAPQSLKPHHETVYQRTARVVRFKHPPQMIEQGLSGEFEVQVTVDADILVKEHATNSMFPFKPNDRVVELKIPTAYANVPDAELEAMGLGQLAQLRNTYLNFDPVQGTLPGRGKTKNAPLRSDAN